MEVEIESALAGEPDKLHDRIRRMFTLVRNSLEEELHGASNNQPPSANGKGHSEGNGNGNGAGECPSGRLATQSQVKAMFAIAKSHGLDLKAFLRLAIPERQARVFDPRVRRCHHR